MEVASFFFFAYLIWQLRKEKDTTDSGRKLQKITMKKAPSRALSYQILKSKTNNYRYPLVSFKKLPLSSKTHNLKTLSR